MSNKSGIADPEKVDWDSLEDVKKFDETLEFVPINPLKRAFDILVSGIFLLLFSPVFLIVVLWNIFKSSGNKKSGQIFLSETRISEGERFEILKFCVLKPSIIEQAREENKNHIKPLEQEAENLTPLGLLLVNTYMDELPQLWNVFVGDMSFVGPRPWPIPVYEKDLENKGLRRKKLIRPGLTGPDQVAKGFPNEYEGGYEGDYRYIYVHATNNALQRFFYDLSLIWKTIYVVFKAEGE